MNKIKFYLAGIFCLCLMFGLSHFALADSTISGTIIKSDGTPLSTELVFLTSNTNAYVDYTDEFGAYSFTVSTAPITGSYVLKPYEYYTVTDIIAIASHAVYYYPQSMQINVVDGANQNNLNFTMNQHGMVTGKISDSSGSPIYGASFFTWDKNGQQLTGSSSSNAIGNFYNTPLYSGSIISGSAGHYQAYVTAIGYLPKYVSDITISDNTTATQNVTLTRKSYITGNIKSKSGSNLADIVVKIYRLGDSSAYFVSQTDQNGNYSIELGRTGSYTTFGDFTAKGKYILEIAGDDTSAYTKKSKNITVSSDESSLSANFTLKSKKGSFSGKVKTKKGAKIEGAMIKVNLLSDPRTTATTYSDSNGNFSFAHLTVGKYQITVSKDGYVNYEMTNKKIKKGTSKTFKMATAGDISGYVFDAVTKKPIAGIVVFMYNSDLAATTTSQGYFVIKNVSTGKHKIFVHYPYYEEQFYSKATTLSKAKNIKVKKNKENKNNNFYLTSYTRVNR